MQAQSHSKKDNQEASDGILVQQALDGDQEAFEALVHRYKTPVLHRIHRYVGECDEAYDVLQQVWLQLYLSLDTLCVDRRIEPWLVKVARSRSIDTLRRRRLLSFSEVETGNSEVSLLDTIRDTDPTPEEFVERRDLQRAVWRAIQTLPYAYRPVVLLRYENDLGFPEIGQALNRSYSTVKSQFYRARSSLRTALTAQLQIT